MVAPRVKRLRPKHTLLCASQKKGKRAWKGKKLRGRETAWERQSLASHRWHSHLLCLLCPRVSVCASILAPHLPQSTSCFLLSPCFSYASVLNTQHQSFIRCRRDDVDVDSNGVGDDGVVCGGAAQIFFHRDAQTNGSQSAQKPLDETLEANTSFSHPHATLLLRSTTERVETTGRPTPPASHCAHGCVCVREREREREAISASRSPSACTRWACVGAAPVLPRDMWLSSAKAWLASGRASNKKREKSFLMMDT